MAKKNISEIEAARQENLEQTVSAAEKFLSKNKKTIIYAACAAVVLGLGILAFVKFVYQPSVEEAQQQAYPAEQHFVNGEYELALNGDGNVLGFADIISEYGTKSGKAVYFFAGACELNLGNYESAISYLKKYNGKEPILAARAKAAQGDAYVGLENYAEAVNCYKAAAATADNVFAAEYLLKEGGALEKLGKKAEALVCYKTIEDKYPNSVEAYDIMKYIGRVSE